MNLLKPPCDEGVISAKKSVSPCGKAQGRWILAATILGSSMSFIDGTVVNVALPALQANLNATAIDVQWVVESYALFLAALLLLGGSLGDLLEGIVLHAFDGRHPFSAETRQRITDLKRIYKLDLDSSASHRLMEKVEETQPRQKSKRLRRKVKR